MTKSIGMKQTNKNPSGVKGSAQDKRPAKTGNKPARPTPYQTNGCK